LKSKELAVPESYNMKTLGEVIAKALGLKPGDDIQILKDRLNANRLLILRVTDEQESDS
jgi:hypothetical protein